MFNNINPADMELILLGIIRWQVIILMYMFLGLFYWGMWMQARLGKKITSVRDKEEETGESQEED